MKRELLPASALPAWCSLNDVTFIDVKVANVENKGCGLVASRDLINEKGNVEIPTLLLIPRGLVLSAEAVEEYAKVDQNFRQLLDATGHKSPRGDILLYLLAQLALSSQEHTSSQGVRTPWTQYFGLLPAEVPIPTMWAELEIRQLEGTSLEHAVKAKLLSLNTEFEELREKSQDLLYWYELLWADDSLTIFDWILLDGLYRSRSLELPKSGPSMVACLDMANHSTEANAYFEENSKDEVALLLRDDCKLSAGEEVTIDYGQTKSAAEMLFSYGFLEPTSAAKNLVYPIESIEDDPLAKAKLHVFGKPPTLEISDSDAGVPTWNAPFMFLACLNEEDGLEFRLLQETDGSRHLELFWGEKNVTEVADTFEHLIKTHELHQVFRLRTISMILEKVSSQSERLMASEKAYGPSEQTDYEVVQTQGNTSLDGVYEYAEMGLVRTETAQAATRLRRLEMQLLTRLESVLETERNQLLQDKNVLAYLESMQAPDNAEGAAQASDEEDDFS